VIAQTLEKATAILLWDGEGNVNIRRRRDVLVFAHLPPENLKIRLGCNKISTSIRTPVTFLGKNSALQKIQNLLSTRPINTPGRQVR